MDKKYYETALLLAAGAVLGQILALLLEMSFSIWSFIPIALVIVLLGGISLRKIADARSMINSGGKVKIMTGIWIFLVWELFRVRFFWIVDLLKFIILFIVLCFFFRMVHKGWEV
jgi:hypothetical protein